MGNDGVAGLKAIKDEGGKTIVESEETAVLFGMPKVAVQLGVADLIVPNYKIKDLLEGYSINKLLLCACIYSLISCLRLEVYHANDRNKL